MTALLSRFQKIWRTRAGSSLKPDVSRPEGLNNACRASLDVADANGDRVTQDIVCIDKLPPQRELSAADPGQIEKIVNEPRLDADVSADGG